MSQIPQQVVFRRVIVPDDPTGVTGVAAVEKLNPSAPEALRIRVLTLRDLPSPSAVTPRSTREIRYPRRGIDPSSIYYTCLSLRLRAFLRKRKESLTETPERNVRKAERSLPVRNYKLKLQRWDYKSKVRT